MAKRLSVHSLTSTITAATSDTQNIPKKSSASSKIPFRATKIRKLTSKPLAEPSVFPKILAPPLTTQSEIDLALAHLRAADPLLRALIEAHQPPSLTSDRSPFQALARSILYQQLSTKAAKTIHDRFTALCGGESAIAPSTVSSLTAKQLREIGVSARKASYLHDLAAKFGDGTLSEASIIAMEDEEEELIARLTAVRGIGVWSVHMFMMFSLRRPDVLPVGDLGVRKGLKTLYGLKGLPGLSEMEMMCEKWKPYRSVGSWYMWKLLEAKKSSD